MTPNIFVVTAVHNSLSHTKKFLKSFSHQTYKNYQIILVDDGSNDGTSSYIKNNYPKLAIITGTGNLWWTGGINLAIETALKVAKAGDYILTINNDCVVGTNYLVQIIKTSLAYDRAIVGSLDVEQETHKIHSGYLYADWQNGVWVNNKRKDLGIRDCDHLTTKGTLFPIEVFKKTGLLDEKHLPHYGSDFEFTHRARKSGFRLLLDPKCVVVCDHLRTGISLNNKNFNMKSAFQLLTSIKSTVNLRDHYFLIKLMCPSKLRLRNYFRLLKKLIYFTIFPLRRIFKGNK